MWVFLKWERAEDDRRVTSVLAIVSVPSLGRSSVPMICRSVVLPAPEGPTILTISPFWMSRSMPLSTSRLPKDLWIFLRDIMWRLSAFKPVNQLLFLRIYSFLGRWGQIVGFFLQSRRDFALTNRDFPTQLGVF